MLEEKKTYQRPEMKVVEINDAEIICTSPGNDPESGENEQYGYGSTVHWF